MTANDLKIKIVSIALISSLITGAATSMYYTNKANKIRYNNEIKEKMTTATFQNEIIKCNHDLDMLREENRQLKEKVQRQQEEISRGSSRVIDVTVTAYTLSPESCEKNEGDDGYGITSTGINLIGHSLWSAKAIAVDPNVIPLGSKVRLYFEDEQAQQYNGIYTAVDTGAAINGNRIDLFFGQQNEEALEFGVRKAKLQII